MRQYLVMRVLISLVVIFFVSILSFTLMNLVPGDPAQALLGDNARPEEVEALRETMGLNVPPVQRYLQWMGGVLRGDSGRSLVGKLQISDLIKQRLPPTIELGILATSLAVLLAIPVGVYSAVRPGSLVDAVATLFMVSFASIPVFLKGIVLILVLGVWLQVLPISGYVPLTEDPVENLKRMVMPVVALALGSSTTMMRQTRSAMIDILHEDYVRTARAKGLGSRTILIRHALRNALIPIITVLGFQLGVIFGGAVITETVFAIPGIGRLFVDSVVRNRDFPVVQTLTLLLGTMTVLINLLVDLSYAFIDPRIRYSR